MNINRKFTDIHEEEGDVGGGQQSGGGAGGEIRFHYKDMYSTVLRDDTLPPHELKHLLMIHQDLHKDRVNKQKMTRKERAALKEGRLHHTAQNRALGVGGGTSKYRQHPISHKAQFSGMDKQTSILPHDFDAETNLDRQNELEHRFVLQNMPKFNPKPMPR